MSVFALGVAVVAQPLVDDNVLEPSVRNEVEYALSRAPERREGARGADVSLLPFATNGLSRTEMAIRLVSEQRRDGRWLVGTNDVTEAAVRLLRSL